MATPRDEHDDPTRLSAFLDGELDDRDRSAFADELRDDPSLRADHDSFLSLVQLLGDLPRPTPPRDLALDAVREIERRGLQAPRPLALKPTGRAPWMVLGTLSAVAASLLLVWLSHVVDFRITLKTHRPPALAQSDTPRPHDLHSESVPTPTTVAVADSSLDLPDSDNPPPATAVLESNETPVSPDVPAALPDLQSRQLAQLLESGEARRRIISVDHLDAFALLRIESAIDESPRVVARHGRLQLDPGVGVDPTVPGEAVVYVLTLRGPEIEALRQRLDHLFPEQIGPETVIEPALLTTLAEVRSPILIHDSIPRSIPLSTPPEGIAVDVRNPADPNILALVREKSPPLRDPTNLPTIPPRTPGDPFNSAQIGPVPAPRPAPAPSVPAEPSVHTYLLWLTKKTAS